MPFLPTNQQHQSTEGINDTRVSQYQKGKTNFIEAGDSEWQWHQLGRMQVCSSLQWITFSVR